MALFKCISRSVTALMIDSSMSKPPWRFRILLRKASIDSATIQTSPDKKEKQKPRRNSIILSRYSIGQDSFPSVTLALNSASQSKVFSSTHSRKQTDRNHRVLPVDNMDRSLNIVHLEGKGGVFDIWRKEELRLIPGNDSESKSFLFISRCAKDRLRYLGSTPKGALSLTAPVGTQPDEVERLLEKSAQIVAVILADRSTNEEIFEKGLLVTPLWIKSLRTAIMLVQVPSSTTLSLTTANKLASSSKLPILVQVGAFQSSSAPPSADITWRSNLAQMLRTAMNSLAMGCSVGEEGSMYGGSLGGFLAAGNDTTFLETCSHIAPSIGATIIHPDNRDINVLKEEAERHRSYMEQRVKDARNDLKTAKQKGYIGLRILKRDLAHRLDDLARLKAAQYALLDYPKPVGTVVSSFKGPVDIPDSFSPRLRQFLSRDQMCRKMMDAENCPAQGDFLDKQKGEIVFRPDALTLDTCVARLAEEVDYAHIPLPSADERVSSIGELCAGMVLDKTGRTTGHTDGGVVIGRRFCIMPMSGVVSREWIIEGKYGYYAFSEREDSGAWAREKGKLVAKIMGKFGGSERVRITVLSPMVPCLQYHERAAGIVLSLPKLEEEDDDSEDSDSEFSDSTH
ncbi:hypothetical protein BJ508DRAFT_310751 [Ascobolus immersus RN42]|uniref:Uncharacterized protein n=1 Tax=Ascobolus immersus RN42 TaxID=1160509 RepID=A0A3N4HWB0_ASCIM|nr:hypothetical protein BJ508DRAFT_310751 [Ascobolus immersus RN42]